MHCFHSYRLVSFASKTCKLQCICSMSCSKCSVLTTLLVVWCHSMGTCFPFSLLHIYADNCGAAGPLSCFKVAHPRQHPAAAASSSDQLTAVAALNCALQHTYSVVQLKHCGCLDISDNACSACCHGQSLTARLCQVCAS